MAKLSKYYTHILRARMFLDDRKYQSTLLAIEEINNAIKIKDCREVRVLQRSAGIVKQKYDLIKEACDGERRLGFDDAYTWYGDLYSLKANGNKFYNIKKAIEYYEKGRKFKDIYSIYGLANIYKSGNGVEQSDEKYIEYVKEIIKVTNRKDLKGVAYFDLGQIYECKKNYKEALKWFKKSADLNNIEAYSRIAVYYLNGWCLRKDISKCMEYNLKDLNKNSFLNMAVVYLDKSKEYFDEKLGVYLIKKAALSGNGRAAMFHSLSLIDEKHPDKNEREILYWMEQAFIISLNDDVLKDTFEALFSAIKVDKYKQIFKSLAKKYWGKESSAA